MGNVVKINRAKKKRDKKYDPYKLNPLKGLSREIVGDNLESAIEKDEDGSIKLDSAGKPVFKDTIEWVTNGPQVMAIWNCAKEVLEQRVVPPNDIDACFDILLLFAKEHRKGNKDYTILIPINYFVGTWHILNASRTFGLFKDDEKLSKSLDVLTMAFAKRIDLYHHIKEMEATEEVKPFPSKDYPKIGSTKDSSIAIESKLEPLKDLPSHTDT